VIYVLEGTQRQPLAYYFDRMFALRHEVFIEQRGWNLATVKGRREIDEYDTNDAVYLIDLTDDNEIQGTVRLTPSEKCSLVADYFPHLIEDGTPARSPLVYEATRYIFRPLSKRAYENRAAKARLLSAMVEWCWAGRLSYLQCIVDMPAFPGWVDLVPQTIPLGLAHPYGGGSGTPGGGDCIAFRWPATREVVQGIRAYGGLVGDQHNLFGKSTGVNASQLVH
jgi:acyl-homoserine lactone synthase